MSGIGREHDLPNDRFMEASLGNPVSLPTAALEQPVGLVGVETGQGHRAISPSNLGTALPASHV
jgi:hypothetical protein